MLFRRVLLVPLGAVSLLACGGPPSAKDYADKAVSFIEGDLAKATQLNGLTFADVVCDEPTSTKPGTEYSCTALGSDGQQRTLTAQIIDRNSLKVTNLVPGPPGPATTTTAAPPVTTGSAPTASG